MKARFLAAVTSALLAASAGTLACGGSDDDSASASPTKASSGNETAPGSGDSASSPSAPGTVTPSPDAGPPAQPITAPKGQWSWVDIEGAVCDDGSPTGIGIWPSASNTDKLIFFFAGGGACWDYQSCITDPKSVHGPFGKKEFDANSPAFGGWVIGQGEKNPFKDWTQVFVPYCTGDLHAGDLVKTYIAEGKEPKVVHHKGRANVAAALARVRATYPTLTKLFVTGSSAGGGGALLSYPALRDAWPNAEGYMVDDSLPFFKTATPLDLRQAWQDNWNLTPLTTPICGASCAVDDLSQAFGGMARRYPKDRMALMSYKKDGVIAGYFRFDNWAFILWGAYWNELANLTRTVLDPNNIKHYYVDTNALLGAHVLLTGMSDGISSWLTQMVTNDPAWTSVN